MIIRDCQPTDAEHQAAIYNAAAGRLPGFRPLSPEEIRRTSQAWAEPGTRFVAEDSGRILGYAGFDPSGRVHFPWCLPGHENLSHLLFGTVLRTLSSRRVHRAFATYRPDWADQVEFFEDHGFHKVREVVNFTQSIAELPTMYQRPGLHVTLIQPEDVSAICRFVPGIPRLTGRAFDEYLKNPAFPADAVYVLRKKDGTPQGVGILIDHGTYSETPTLDPGSPNYWFGAFGTEGLPARCVNGLFSFLAPAGRDAELIGQSLLWYGMSRIETNTFESLSAQVPGDVPHLLSFYQRYFQRVGSFTEFERTAGGGSQF